jgi:hypothetical protein
MAMRPRSQSNDSSRGDLRASFNSPETDIQAFYQPVGRTTFWSLLYSGF